MLLTWGLTLLALAAVMGILVVLLPRGATIGADTYWNGVMADIRQPWMLSIAYFMNWIGGGWRAILLVPGLIIAGLLVARRPRQALFAAASFLVCVGLTQLLKQAFGRARPDDLLVASDYGSFPSGHTSNAAAIALVLWLVLPRVWVGLAGALWVVIMALSRTVLAVHWATDTVGGALVGAAAVLLVAALMARWASLGWTGSAESRPRSRRAADPPLP